jgi:hypothetical protein
VEYQLTAEVVPPVGTPALDALQRHGVAALLDEHLDLLAEIEGPDGVEIEPVDHRVSVQDGGASITWVLDAPALAFAEDAARQVLGELLERTELLTDWAVRRCEVTASDEDLAAALAGVDVGDDDTAQGDVEIEIDLDELDELTLLGEPSDDDVATKRDHLSEAAEALGAFGPDAFGHDSDDPDNEISEDDAALVAGALIAGLELLTEELFVDIQTLEDAGTPASEHEVLWVLHDLPTRYAGHYTALFAKKFLITTAVLGYRLALPDWDGPLNTAEVLAIRLAEGAARNQLDAAGLTDELPLDAMFETFEEYAFGDLDVTDLFETEAEAGPEAEADDEDDVDELVLVDWFEPFADEDDDDESEEDEFDVADAVDQTVQA